MADRLRGLGMVTRALAPVLILVLLGTVTWVAADRLAELGEDYGRVTAGHLGQIREAVEEVDEGLQALAGFAVAAAEAASAASREMVGLEESLIIPLPGGVEIAIPGSRLLKGVAAALAEAGVAVTGPAAKVGALSEVPGQLEQAGEDALALGGKIGAAAGAWRATVLLLLAAAGLVWVAGNRRAMAADLRCGAAMLMGRPAPPEVEAASMARRLADLQRDFERFR